MAREARGIEVFGRGATVVEHGAHDTAARTPALGAAAALLAVMAAAALIGAIIERSRGSSVVEILAWIALGASAVAVLAGLVAMLTGRGRLLGFVGLVLGALANPWLLTRLLEWAALVE